MNPPRQAVKPVKRTKVHKGKQKIRTKHALTAKHFLSGSLTIPKKDAK